MYILQLILNNLKMKDNTCKYAKAMLYKNILFFLLLYNLGQLSLTYFPCGIIL